jgi:hypothetical protein
MPEYDPATCITAGELRAVGIPVPESVPDCGWIPRGSMAPGPEEPTTSYDPATGIITAMIPTCFTQPFRWFELDLATNTVRHVEMFDPRCEARRPTR